MVGMEVEYVSLVCFDEDSVGTTASAEKERCVFTRDRTQMESDGTNNRKAGALPKLDGIPALLQETCCSAYRDDQP